MPIGPIFRALRRSGTRVVLLVLEIAFTLTIVLNCLNMISAQRSQMTRPTGIDEAHLIAVEVRPYGASYQEQGFLDDVVTRDLAALRRIPGVAAVTPISTWPLQGGGSSFMAKPLGAPDSAKVQTPTYTVDEHFLDTLGLELVAGRTFTAEDRPVTSGPQPLNIIVTQDFADALFPDGDALGKLIDSGNPDYPDTIIGIVKYMYTPYGGGPKETRINFYPGQPAGASEIDYLVRTAPDAMTAVLAAVDPALQAIDRERVMRARPLTEIKSRALALNRFVIQVLSVLVALLLFVTTLGIFGMTSFSVTQRTRQIGTRRALGASQGAILGHFLIESSVLSAMGIGLGLVGAYALNMFLVAHLDGTRLAPGLLVVGVVLLWALGLLATAAPALRAARLSPAIATRSV
jgi:putative ABC transport system permease protein